MDAADESEIGESAGVFGTTAQLRRRPQRRLQGPVSQPSLIDLTIDECLELLRTSEVGRIAVSGDGRFPAVFPVNYLTVETDEGKVLIAFRTRKGNVIDTAPSAVAFQVDGIDTARHEGWSILVRGWLHHADQGTHPGWAALTIGEWLTERDSLVLIEPERITGRRLRAGTLDWPFHPHAYL